jgi:serralysin
MRGIAMAYAESAERAGNPSIDGLLFGMRWNSLELTYSFPQQASLYGQGYGLGEPDNNFEPLNGHQMEAARGIFNAISAATLLSFREIAETTSVHADLRLAMSDVPNPAWTYTIDDGAEGGDIWFGNSSGWYDSPTPGTYAFWAFLHEIGHALGLKHGHEEGGFGVMPFAQDSMEFTVTTYRSYVGAGNVLENETYSYAQTLMTDDLAALQHLYGANYATRSGNTVYQWSPKTGQMFVDGVGQPDAGDNRVFMTIWDGGGLDTYNLSNSASNLSIDLRPAAWSTLSDRQLAYLGGFLNFARGNISNPLLYQGDPRSLIENATGGSGNDRLVGNDAANLLRGGKGADQLTGLLGDDTLIGGYGNDILRGGLGADEFWFDTKANRAANTDRIADFDTRVDRICLDNAIFKALGKGSPTKPVALKKAFFTIGDHAKDANDFVIFDARKGLLFYDADGSDAGEAVRFATLTKGLKLTAADFFVV